MMNYCAMETKTDMTPSVPVERENLKMLMRMTKELPEFQIVVQQPTRKVFNSHAGLTYNYMEDFIKSIAPERIPEFQAIRVTYRSYPAVKRWFLEAFPEVNENLWFAA